MGAKDFDTLSGVDPRRELLQVRETAHAEEWSSFARTVFIGRVGFQTKNATYSFIDGVCVQISRNDGLDEVVRGLLGMVLIGWVIPVGQDFTLAQSPMSGHSAVLWRPQPGRPGAFTLTSATQAVGNGVIRTRVA